MENTNPNVQVINPKTKRIVKIGGDTCNRLIAEGYEYYHETNTLKRNRDIVENLLQNERSIRNIVCFTSREELETQESYMYRRYDINNTNITEKN